jgi:nucleoid-associated protein EbfC
MKQMQKKFQENLTKIQDDLESQVVEGSAGGGMVKIEMNGKQELISVKIDKSVVNPEEVDILEDLIVVAFKDALTRSQALGASMINQLTGGMKIPGLF